jgi:hypothetical protein
MRKGCGLATISPDLTIDLDPDVDEPTANAEQRHSFMGCEALDLNLLQPTHTHHLGEPPRVITIGRTERAAWAWRASMQITGRPAAFNACQSHVDVGPSGAPRSAA